MRRNEFTSQEDGDFNFIVQNATVGYLGIITSSGFPRIVPLNFAAIGKTIYFHGAKEGEKYDILMKSPKVAFSIDVPYSFIPSYFEGQKSACPATHFFKSAHIKGEGMIVTDTDEKAEGLNHLMLKYQPEGNYAPLSSSEKMYRKPLDEVAVFKIIPSEITMKIKFGQNLSLIKYNQVIEGLKKRGDEIDLQTISEMKARYPNNTN